MDSENDKKENVKTLGRECCMKTETQEDQVTTETDWSDASTNKGRPRAASTHQKLESLHREHDLSDTSVSNI